MDSHARDALDSYHRFSSRLLGEASHTFGRLLSHQQSLNAVLEELHHSRESCRLWMERQSSLSQESFRNCHSFLSLLDAAISQRNEEAKTIKKEQDISRQNVEECHRHCKAIEQTIEQRAEKEQIFARCREQKNQDEQAARMHLQLKK